MKRVARPFAQPSSLIEQCFVGLKIRFLSAFPDFNDTRNFCDSPISGSKSFFLRQKTQGVSGESESEDRKKDLEISHKFLN